MDKKIKKGHKEAVITLLHVNYDKYLLQLRDFKSHIAFPGFWGGFGGQVEKGESPVMAGVRELEEELGYSPDPVIYFCDYFFDKEIARDKTDLYLHVCYGSLKVPVSDLILTEGQDMGLFSRKEIVERQLYSKKLAENFPIPDHLVGIFCDFFKFISLESQRSSN